MEHVWNFGSEDARTLGNNRSGDVGAAGRVQPGAGCTHVSGEHAAADGNGDADCESQCDCDLAAVCTDDAAGRVCHDHTNIDSLSDDASPQ